MINGVRTSESSRLLYGPPFTLYSNYLQHKKRKTLKTTSRWKSGVTYGCWSSCRRTSGARCSLELLEQGWGKVEQNEHGKSESSPHHQGSKTSGRNMNAKHRQNEMASDTGHKSSYRDLFASSFFFSFPHIIQKWVGARIWHLEVTVCFMTNTSV